MQELIKNEFKLSKLIINTRFGAVPYLNDFLLETFRINFMNVKLCDLNNYFDVFEKFISPDNKFYNPKERAINNYFRLNYSYLTFLDHKDFNDTLGIGEENSLFYIANTGKCKISFPDYIKVANTLDPDLCLIPFEYVSELSSIKRIERSVKKLYNFISLTSKTANKNYICPILLYHLNYYDINRIQQYNNIAGYSIIIEDYKKLNYEQIIKYQVSLREIGTPETSVKIKCGVGHPRILIGCQHYEISYPFDISEKAMSINSDFEFPVRIHDKLEIKLDEINIKCLNLKLLNLKDEIYSEDNKILKVGCKCFTCSNNYTKAYIHHLLKCNEINATILLIMYNSFKKRHNLYFVQELIKSFEEHLNKSLYFYNFLTTQCE